MGGLFFFSLKRKKKTYYQIIKIKKLEINLMVCVLISEHRDVFFQKEIL